MKNKLALLYFLCLMLGCFSVAAAAQSKEHQPMRFLMYNVHNYFVEGEKARVPYLLRPKKEYSRNAVVDVIVEARPDVVGLIEIGGELALTDLQQRLQKRGLDLPHRRVLNRKGASHSLAILSRYPIVRDDSQADYPRQGRKLLRGVLDVLIKRDAKRQYRIVGAHLKAHDSKNQKAATSQRTYEAKTLADYLARSMKKQSKMPVLVYGDWNDEPRDATLAPLVKMAKLKLLEAKDAEGKPWTLYYKAGNAHLIFDQIYVNAPLWACMKKQLRMGIMAHPRKGFASDHRAVWCELP